MDAPRKPVTRPRSVPLTEQLQRIANESTVKLAAEGFSAIDKLASAGTEHLDRQGIMGTGPLIERAALELKKLIAQGITGRKPQ